MLFLRLAILSVLGATVWGHMAGGTISSPVGPGAAPGEIIVLEARQDRGRGLSRAARVGSCPGQ